MPSSHSVSFNCMNVKIRNSLRLPRLMKHWKGWWLRCLLCISKGIGIKVCWLLPFSAAHSSQPWGKLPEQRGLPSTSLSRAHCGSQPLSSSRKNWSRPLPWLWAWLTQTCLVTVDFPVGDRAVSAPDLVTSADTWTPDLPHHQGRSGFWLSLIAATRWLKV